ncbi:MAG: hypothetical protein JSS76_12845 [Bacteroidetes bacterium]|nr:hypothetical protein [Bacteroidota bacterium]
MSKISIYQSYRQRVIQILESLVEVAAISGAPLPQNIIYPATPHSTDHTSFPLALRDH